jgi:hypothetical protein
MKIQQALVALTVINVALLLFLLAQTRQAGAQGAPGVLRGRGLQIVDERGKIRASITLYPADPTVKMPDGTRGYPETVLFRLINSQGRPNVKIEATEDGAGVGLGGESDPTYALLTAKRTRSSLKLTDKDGRQQVIKP